MTIKFSKEMRTTFNHSMINYTSAEMRILPSEEREFDPNHLEFTWNITSYEKDLMKIQLNFTNAIWISPL